MSYIAYRQDLLVAFERATNMGATPRISLAEFLEEFPDLAAREIDDALDELEKLECIAIDETARDKIISVTPRGYDRATEISAKRALSETTKSLASSAKDAPAAGRIVKINHNSAELSEATDAIEEAILAVNQSNEIGTDDPDEKERLATELDAGKRLLSADSVDLEKITAVLFKALKFIIEKFASTAVSKLAARALDALEKLFAQFL